MPDLSSLIKDIIQYRKLILSQRFRYVFLLVGLAYIAYMAECYMSMLLLGIGAAIFFSIAMFMFPWEKSFFIKVDEAFAQYDLEKLKPLILNSPFLVSYSAKIKFLFAKVDFYKHDTFDTQKIFDALQHVEEFYLLSDEKTRLYLKQAEVYHSVGNGMMLDVTIAELAGSELSDKENFLYQTLKSFSKELHGYINEAKNDLYKLQANVPKDRRSNLFNNIARLEEMTGNLTQALHYYEKAAEALMEKPKPILYHSIYHNLIIFNAKRNKLEEAKKWLQIYENAVDKSVLTVYLEYLNTQVLLARQLSDRGMLVEAYAKMSVEIEPKLSRERWLAHFISKLRMSYSDGMNFQENIMQAKFLFDELKVLEFPKNYFAAKEIFHILKELANNNQIGPMGGFFKDVIEFMSGMHEEIRSYRKTLPDLAVGEQWHWLEEQNFLRKLNMVSKPEQKQFDEFFRELFELARIASGYENSYFATKAYMVICDEYLAYCRVLGEQFCNDYNAIAIKALENASVIVESNKDNHQFAEFLVGLGYYFKHIGNDTQKANEYLNLFEEKHIAIMQFAPWFRNHYNDLKSG